MRERTTKTRNADGTTTIEVEVSGDGAYEAAREAVSREMSDLDPERVQTVEAAVELGPPGESDGESSDDADSRHQTRPHLTGNDVERAPLPQGTTAHEAAHILREANAAEDPMSSKEVSNIVRDMRPQSASGAFTELFRRGLVTRDAQSKSSGGVRYVYQLTDWGESELDRVGPYPYDD